MKKSALISAFAITAFFLLREFFKKEGETAAVPEPRKKHLTNAFSKAKEQATASS